MTATIDIHDHIFSGRDIPLEGYLFSRKYDQWTIRLAAPILLPLLAYYIRRQGPRIDRPLEHLVMDLAYRYLGQGYRRWVEVLSLRTVSEIAARMVATYEKDSVDLFVPLMIDFEYWFLNTPDNPIQSQVESVYRNVVLPYKGRIHPFVPFDPARELAFRKKLPNPDASKQGIPEEVSSLKLVKDAIRNKGFIGVKVYNTLGYRPLGNAAVDKERRSIFRKNGMESYIALTGEEIDEVLEELYAYCVKEQVPLTAHCVSNGIEAYPGASLVFAGPRYWRPVLDKYPNLHLNLAHYGWSQPHAFPPRGWRPSWTRRPSRPSDDIDPDGGESNWTSEITEMLPHYKHLYTDVAHHGVVVEKDVPKFIASYRAIVHDYPGVLQERLLYGTDWHVFTRMDNFLSFEERYHRIWQEKGLFSEAEVDHIMGGNALQFLGLLPKNTPRGHGWTKNRERLEEFYAKHKIKPPLWFHEVRTAGKAKKR